MRNSEASLWGWAPDTPGICKSDSAFIDHLSFISRRVSFAWYFEYGCHHWLSWKASESFLESKMFIFLPFWPLHLLWHLWGAHIAECKMLWAWMNSPTVLCFWDVLCRGTVCHTSGWARVLKEADTKQALAVLLHAKPLPLLCLHPFFKAAREQHACQHRCAATA